MSCPMLLFPHLFFNTFQDGIPRFNTCYQFVMLCTTVFAILLCLDKCPGKVVLIARGQRFCNPVPTRLQQPLIGWW